MISRGLIKFNGYKKIYNVCCKRKVHEMNKDLDHQRIRNIGILAHIDAGKTTTTERILYYSGQIKSMGEVHKGTTVTDFMQEERNRGITISSACVSFEWKNHLFNLIDTPGHIDFTAEVEQALNVTDGAVIVLDASAGVEVQTVTVWKQADEKEIPFLVYANKMDRPDSDILLCERSLKNKLGVLPLILHIPLKDKSKFYGMIDLISMKKIIWSKKGMSFCEINKLDEHYTTAIDRRNFLIDVLSSLDNDLADSILNSGSFEAVTKEELEKSVRKITCTKKGIPVVCGSSYKNIGIETLLDAVIKYLPSPLQCVEHQFNTLFKEDIIGKAFKVLHDKQKGPLLFFRLYSGNLCKGQKVYNFHKEKADRALFLYKAFADEMNEVFSISSGNFVAVSGLKSVQSGDIICSSVSAAKKLRELTSKSKDSFKKFLQSSLMPKPVFFCSIEPPSQFFQLALDKALLELSHEDPSLKITYNNETGQTVLGGMGELHLEVVKDRLKTEYKIDAEMGPLQIIYKEKPLSNILETYNFHKSMGSKEYNIDITLSLRAESSPEVLRLDTSKEASQNLAHITTRNFAAIKHGVVSGFSKGPLMSCEVIDSHIVLHCVNAPKKTPDSLLVAATSQSINKMLKTVGTMLLEPIMEVNIAIEDIHLNSVLGDLSRRRANILNILSNPNTKEIVSEVPLAELRGYAKYLRTTTSGSAKLTMEFASYKGVLPDIQERIMNGI